MAVVQEHGEVSVSHKLTVLIVDDELIYRTFLSRVMAALDGVELVPPAANGRIALARLKAKAVDLVLLDMKMPEMSGLETLRRIRQDHPEVGVIMISGEYASDAKVVIEALELGALDFLPKAMVAEPDGNSVLTLRAHLRTLFHQFQGRRALQQARRMASRAGNSTDSGRTQTDVVPGSGTADPPCAVHGGPPSRTVPVRAARFGRIEVVAIGTSTGGPNALGEVIPRLPKDLAVPILIVQHMPPFLTASLAQSLDAKSAMGVHEALDNEPLEAGNVYLAPGGRHLTVASEPSHPGGSRRRFIRLDDGPPENSVRPSADVLFRAVAKSFGGHTLAVIMTGMGNDGMKGVQALKEHGCYCITQTQETCVVYGMPRAVDEAALSNERVDLHAIAGRIIDLVAGTTPRRIS